MLWHIHSSLKPEFSIEYTVADVEKCKNELLHKAIEDSIQKAQVLTTAANVKWVPPAAYDIDIEADDIDVTDTVTVVWEIS